MDRRRVGRMGLRLHSLCSPSGRLTDGGVRLNRSLLVNDAPMDVYISFIESKKGVIEMKDHIKHSNSVISRKLIEGKRLKRRRKKAGFRSRGNDIVAKSSYSMGYIRY